MFPLLPSLQAHLCSSWCPGQARYALPWKSSFCSLFLPMCPHTLLPDIPRVLSPISPSQWDFSCRLFKLTFSLLLACYISLHSTYYPARSVSLNLSLHSAVHPSIHPSTYPPIHPSTHLCALLIVCLLCQDHKGIFVCFLFTVESRGHIKAPLTISPTQGQMQAGALGQASARTPLCHASSF